MVENNWVGGSLSCTVNEVLEQVATEGGQQHKWKSPDVLQANICSEGYEDIQPALRHVGGLVVH